MIASNKLGFLKLVHALGVLSLTVMAVSCSLPEPQKNEDSVETSTFIIESTTGHSRSTTNNERLQIPQSRTYEMKVCLKDRAYLKPMSLQGVRIQENDQTITTDSSGCMVWTENISFNYFEAPHWIEVTKHLEGQGYHQGVSILKVAVNPWELDGDNSDVLDLKNITLSELNLKKSNTSDNARVFVKTLKIEKMSQEVQDKGLQVRHLIRIEPVIERKNIKGNLLQIPLQGTQLKAHLKISQDGEVIEKDLTFAYRDGSWQSEISIIHGSVSNESKSTASLKLTEDILKNYVSDSNFNLGLGSAWVQGMEGKTYALETNSDTSSPMSLSVGKTSPSETPEDSSRLGTSVTDSPINVDQIQSSVIRVVTDNEAHRELQLSVKSCLRNKVTGAVLNNTTIKMTDWNGTESSIKTDDNGCFSYQNKYAYSESSCHDYKTSSMTLTLPSGAVLELPIYIYPWSASQPILDARYTDKQSVKSTCANEGLRSAGVQKPAEDLLINKVQVSPLEQGISIGNLLEMHVQKKIRFEVSPLVKIQGDSSGQVTYSPLRDETWNMEVLIQNPWSPSVMKKVVYQVQEVKSISGLLMWEVIFDTNDLQTLEGLVEVNLHFENKSRTHTSGIIRGRLHLGSNPSILNVQNVSGDWNSLVNWAKQQDAFKQKATAKVATTPQLQIYAKTNGLVLTNKNIFAHLGIKDVWKEKNLQSYFANYTQSKNFCAAWFTLAHPEHSATPELANFMTACAETVSKNFSAAFGINTAYEISRVVNSKVIQSEQRMLSISTSYNNGFSFSEVLSESAGFSVGIDAGAGQGKSVGLAATKASAGLMGGYNVDWRQARGSDKTLRQVIGESKNLVVSHYVTEMNAETSKRCMSVNLNPQLFNQSGKKLMFQKVISFFKGVFDADLRTILGKALNTKNIEELKKGILICESANGNHNLKDDYYIISEANQDTTLQNGLDPNVKPWFMAIRGKGDYQQLTTILAGQIPSPKSYEFSENSVQRLLYETNYFESLSSVPKIWINPPTF